MAVRIPIVLTCYMLSFYFIICFGLSERMLSDLIVAPEFLLGNYKCGGFKQLVTKWWPGR